MDVVQQKTKKRCECEVDGGEEEKLKKCDTQQAEMEEMRGGLPEEQQGLRFPPSPLDYLLVYPFSVSFSPSLCVSFPPSFCPPDAETKMER